MATAMNSDPPHISLKVGNTNQTNDPEYIRGGIRCPGRVCTPCQPAQSAMNLIFKSGKRSNPGSQSMCEELPND
jgi:hypothetical protein